MKRFLIVLVLASCFASGAQASIFKCTVEDGSEVISNKRIGKSCKLVVTDSETSLPAPKGQPKASANPSPASFPKVTEDTQKSRDKDRKHILEQELAGEQGKLQQAKKELAEQEALGGADKTSPKAVERIQPYKDRVAQHERNIAAINKELSGLK